MYYVDEDGKTVRRARVHAKGIELDDGRVIEKYGSRLFAVHPNENTLFRVEEDGTFSYENPEAKFDKGRRFFRPGGNA